MQYVHYLLLVKYVRLFSGCIRYYLAIINKNRMQDRMKIYRTIPSWKKTSFLGANLLSINELRRFFIFFVNTKCFFLRKNAIFEK